MYFVSIDYGTVNPFAVGIFDFDGRKSTMIKEVHYSGRESGVRKDNEEYYKMMDDAIGSLSVESITWILQQPDFGNDQKICKYIKGRRY